MSGRSTAKLERFESVQAAVRAQPTRPKGGTGKRCRGGRAEGCAAAMIGRSTAKLERFDWSLQTAVRAQPTRAEGGTGRRCRGGPRRAVMRP